MPEYLAPGVFVEEVSFRQKTIEGVSTSTTGFIGPACFGPVLGEPELLTSFSDFERIHGGLDQLEFVDLNGRTDNDLAHAVRAYFEEGGRRLYVARIFNEQETDGGVLTLVNGRWSDGVARWASTDSPPAAFSLRARYPGRCGNFTATFVFRLGEDVLGETPLDPSDVMSTDTIPVLRGVNNFDTVLARPAGSPPTGAYDVYWIERFFDETILRDSYRLRQDDPGEPPSATPTELDEVGEVRVLTVSILVSPLGRFGDEKAWEDLSFHPEHPRSLANYFGQRPFRRSLELQNPLVFETGLANGSAIADELLAQVNMANTGTVLQSLEVDDSSDAMRTFRLELTGGNDGEQPRAGQYEGDDGEADGLKSGLRAFEDLEDISIVAAPGSTRDFATVGGVDDQADPIMRLLISHCERMRYRVAVLDSIEGHVQSEVRAMRGGIDTTRAALYYPWVRIFDPVTEREILQPPSGFVSGIYARNDIERGVHKAPANEVIRLALGFEFLLNKAQQEALNPLGINCLRFFEGRGYRVWGARTATSDGEWKYLNVRRYFAFLERSIEKGTQFAVFENNGEVLWANVRSTIEDFLFNEWKSNHLMGTKPEEAFFVRCDRSTMTQNDLDNGRLICLIGVAPLRPAEFVIFRIGQKTADSTS